MTKLSYRSTLRGCYLGYVVQAINNNLTPVLFVIFQDSFGLSLKLLSSIILANFITQLLIDVSSVKIADKFGYRATMIFALAMSAVGLILLGTLPRIMSAKFWAVFISTMIFSVGGGLIEVVVSPITDMLPLGEKKSTMAMLHSFYCWGQLAVVLASTLFIKFCGGALWYILPFIWACVPLANIVVFCLVPIVNPLEKSARMHLKTLLLDPSFVLATLVMLCAGASELTISQWSSLFAEKGLGVSKFVGDLLGPCAFALLMGLGRIFYGFFGSKINMRKVLTASAVLTIICFLLTSVVPNRYVSLIACGASGLAVSLLWPGTLSNTAEHFPKAGTLLFGILAFSGDLGCSLGPAIAGFVADAMEGSAACADLAQTLGMDIAQLSMRGGILVCTVFPILMLACILVFNRRTSRAIKSEIEADLPLV